MGQHTFWRSMCIMLLLLLLSSCVSHQKYPLEWPPLISIANEKCPDISGIFVNEGERPDKTKRYLSDAFEKTEMYKDIGQRKKDVDVTHVKINRPDNDTLEILFWNNDTLVDKNIYSRKKKEYSCTPEGIRIPLGSGVSSQMGEGIIPVGINWLTLYLTKNTDGELVIRYTSSGVGLALIVPIAGSTSDYVRFRQKRP